jgi:PKD repeat protein
MVSFDASASQEPTGACGTINSYILDFGDGSPPASNAAPMFSHTYSTPGSYPARLTVSDTVGEASTNLAQQVITVTSAGPPQLQSVASRITHGSAGDFDVDLPLTGATGIECRSGGANGNYTLVFTFANPLVSVGQATVTSGVANVVSSTFGTDSHSYIVNLTGVTNAQRITVALVNARDSTNAVGNVSVSMGVLLGDVNATGRVDAADVSLVRQQTLHPLTSSNFREDVNATGRIDAADVSLVRQQTLTALP